MNATAVLAVRTLSVHDPRRRRPAVEVTRLQQALRRFPEVAHDQGAATGLLESEIAVAVGQQAALLLPSGKMAQQIALRIHADRGSGVRVTLAHPANHLSLWEDANLAVLHGMQVRALGDPYRLMTTSDIAAGLSDAGVTAVLWELPQRELGGELPSWEELNNQLGVAAARGVATHLDGARVWQVSPFFHRSLARICGLFDSVYVSLYKDLGAPSGAVLAGSQDFIAAARRWRHRLGGTIDNAWPLALLALDGLHHVPELMPRLVAHTRAVAAEIQRSTTATTRPEVPHAAMFHVHLPIAAEQAREAHDHLVRETGLRLALHIRTGPDARRCWFEVTVGEEALNISPRQVADLIRRLIALAAPGAGQTSPTCEDQDLPTPRSTP